jgi:glutathione reductase (NADPH)
MNLNVPGSGNIITSDQFLELGYDNLPDKILFVDGGYISFEFAHIAARAGANVTWDDKRLQLLSSRIETLVLSAYLK